MSRDSGKKDSQKKDDKKKEEKKREEKKKEAPQKSRSSLSSLTATSSGPSTIFDEVTSTLSNRVVSKAPSSRVTNKSRSSSIGSSRQNTASKADRKPSSGTAKGSKSRASSRTSSRTSSRVSNRASTYSSSLSAQLKTNIKQQGSRIFDARTNSVSMKSRSRVNPIETKVANRNLPAEATIEDMPSVDSSRDPLDPVNIYTEQVREEFHKETISRLAGTECDPELFLKPMTPEQAASDSFLDRQVDPNKLIDFMVRHMKLYYDLSTDGDVFSQRRQQMDDRLWDNLAYLIPLLCRQMIDLLRNEPIIVTDVKPGHNHLVFGDIHGNFNDIYFVYHNFFVNPKYSKSVFVFLGDFVDRGPKGIEVLCFLFAQKLANPERFLLLRGNHEIMRVNRKYGFKCLCTHVFSDTYIRNPVVNQLIYKSFNRAFCYLPIGAVIRSSASGNSPGVWCGHGGIPSQYLKNETNRHTGWHIGELNTLTSKPVILAPSKKALPQELALNEILWNDPIPERLRNKRRFRRRLFFRNKKRGGHCSFFTEAGLQAFLDANNLTMVIRGHQYRHSKKSGFKHDFDGRLLTIFSSSNYCGTERNTTGYATVSATSGTVTATVLRESADSARYKDFNVFKIIVDEHTKEVTRVLF